MNEIPQITAIFVGPQGSGKGTQAEMLKRYLTENDPTRKTLHFDAGDAIRSFADKGGYTQDIIAGSMKRGDLLPLFVIAHVWSDFFINSYTGTEHVLVDGLPREESQLRLLHSAFKFYKLKPVVIFVNLSEESSVQRLMARGRSDDTPESIRKRLSWYNQNIQPIISWFHNCPDYTFIEVDGEPTVEEIHQDIVRKLHLK